MPELPEVEAARRAVAEHSVGKKIIKAIVADDAKVIDGVSPADFEAALVGKTIVAAHRKGKNMWIELDSPPFPSFQFGTVSIFLFPWLNLEIHALLSFSFELLLLVLWLLLFSEEFGSYRLTGQVN